MYTSIDSKNLKRIKISEYCQKRAKPVIERGMRVKYTEIIKQKHLKPYKNTTILQIPKVQDSSVRSPISDCRSTEKTSLEHTKIKEKQHETKKQ